MQGISHVGPFQTLGHDISCSDQLWLFALVCSDELVQAFQYTQAFRPCQLHDILGGNTAGLLPTSQSENPEQSQGPIGK